MARNRISPGKHKHLLEIQSYVADENASGEQERTWSKLVDRYAELLPGSGREVLQAGQVRATTRRVYKVYKIDDATPDLRALNKQTGLYWSIQNIRPDPTDAWYQLLDCEQTAAAVTP